MKLHRYKAIILQEYFITLRSVETLFDILVMPVLTIVVFGFLSLYLTANADAAVANNVIMGMLMWQTLFIAQYSVTVPSLWNIWSRNLSMLFVTPLTITEYISAHATTATIKSILFFILSATLCQYFFHFDITQLGIGNLVLILANLIIFAIALGIILLGLIFRYGTKIQALSWGFISILQPLCAALYPLSIVPEPFRSLALALPATYIFEGVRTLPGNANAFLNHMLIAFLLNIVLLIISIYIFKTLFSHSKISGQFARNEG